MRKYKNKKANVDGITFDSEAESKRYIQLRLLEKAGHISNLQLQVRYELIPKQKDERSAVYIADFVYNECGKTVVEDVKGYATEVYKLKRKLFKYRYPDIEFREVRN